MKKVIVKMASMVLIFVMCLTSLVGCGLITTDTERDMAQVIATVQIDENAPKDEILKKDIIMGYFNYGYMYEQYYGYSRQDVYQLIIDSLVENRIFVQSAIKAQYDASKGWNVESYLSDEAKLEANYSALKNINDLLESYDKEEVTEKADTAWVEARTTPTNAANKEEEVNKAEYVNAGVISVDVNTYNKVIELLRVNELLGDGYDGKDIRTTDYYKETLNSYQESELISAYEKSIKDKVIANFIKDANGNVSLDKLNQAYLDKRTAQSELSDSELITKYSEATASDPILVGRGDGSYGYVYNLLLGADTTLTSKISNIKADEPNMTQAKYVEERNKILEATVITDQRSSWISSGYDFDFATKKFTGDYTFSTNYSLEFKGTVEKYENIKEDATVKGKVLSLTQYNLNSFITMMDEYVYGSVAKTVANGNPTEAVYRKVQCNADVVEYTNKINELLFAFSTDSGSLNTYKGYLIKPTPQGADSEEYVQEFADAARELIGMPDNKYGYIVVATDYGYHVMFYSEILKADYGYASLTEYLDALYGAQDWNAKLAEMAKDWDNVEDTEHYLYLIANGLFSTDVSNAVSEYQRNTLNAYRYAEDGGVTLYEDTYADLLA